MDAAAMLVLVQRHLAALCAGDSTHCVAMYADDVEHDVVGSPHGPLYGGAAAKGFYDDIARNTRTETMEQIHSYLGDDFCVIEHLWTGTVPGTLLGVAGNGRRVDLRLLHVWEFRDDQMSRENVWFDAAGLLAQLTAPELR
jgi:steroid delta-isomerase-like uncharacterized protein